MKLVIQGKHTITIDLADTDGLAFEEQKWGEDRQSYSLYAKDLEELLQVKDDVKLQQRLANKMEKDYTKRWQEEAELRQKNYENEARARVKAEKEVEQLKAVIKILKEK